MNRSVRIVFLFLSAVLLPSCDHENPDNNRDEGFLKGAYITNEGAFGNSNGSVSYFDIDSAYVINHLFESVNGRPLGDVVQSMAISGDQAFIVVNNSQKVEVVDLKTFLSAGVIDGLEYPRTFLPVNDKKGYLTDGNFRGRVYVVDLATLKITDTIPCGSGPEKMIIYRNKVFVANSGGWGNDSTLTVIDTASDRVAATWTVGMNPADLVLDRNDQLWALCKGKVVWNQDWTIGEETSSSLVVIDPETGKIKQTRMIGSVGDFYWPQRMGISRKKDLVYFLEANGINSVSLTGEGPQPLISRNLYGFGVDPQTGLIYALLAPSFTTSGWMLRFNSGGQLLDSLEVGIGPSQIVFN